MALLCNLVYPRGRNCRHESPKISSCPVNLSSRKPSKMMIAIMILRLRLMKLSLLMFFGEYLRLKPSNGRILGPLRSELLC